jgi:hypothetical protein
VGDLHQKPERRKPSRCPRHAAIIISFLSSSLSIAPATNVVRALEISNAHDSCAVLHHSPLERHDTTILHRVVAQKALVKADRTTVITTMNVQLASTRHSVSLF